MNHDERQMKEELTILEALLQAMDRRGEVLKRLRIQKMLMKPSNV
jgi:hypothetical protein